MAPEKGERGRQQRCFGSCFYKGSFPLRAPLSSWEEVWLSMQTKLIRSFFLVVSTPHNSLLSEGPFIVIPVHNSETKFEGEKQKSQK